MNTRPQLQVLTLVAVLACVVESNLRHRQQQESLDFSKYSIAFHRCVTLEDNLTKSTTSSVLFRVCPGQFCAQCDDSTQVGEYLIPLEDYLFVAVHFIKHQQEKLCQICDRCQDVFGRVSIPNNHCTTCQEDCAFWENMQDTDATIFRGCTSLSSYGHSDWYVSPTCNQESGGALIDLGLYRDTGCQGTRDESMQIDDLIDGRISWDLMGLTTRNVNKNDQNENELCVFACPDKAEDVAVAETCNLLDKRATIRCQQHDLASRDCSVLDRIKESLPLLQEVDSPGRNRTPSQGVTDRPRRPQGIPLSFVLLGAVACLISMQSILRRRRNFRFFPDSASRGAFAPVVEMT